LQRSDAVNIIVVVTRYFWWVKLQSDRFKNVIDATKIFLEHAKNPVKD
jgi:putative IMPACT (imprinted ancient) family translation regulator